MSTADSSLPVEDAVLAAKRQHWRRRQRVLFWIAGVLLVANIIRTAWPLIEPVVRQVEQRLAARRAAAELAKKEAAKAVIKERIASQTTKLPDVDRIEVCLLSEEEPKGSGFPLHPYKCDATIVKRVVITDERAEELAERWRRCEFGGHGALCHEPLYGLRFFSGEKLLCETSLCWMCWNCQLKVEGDEYDWVGFHDPIKQLAGKLEEILPPSKDVQAVFAENRAIETFDDDPVASLAHARKAIALDASRLKAWYLIAEAHEKDREVDKAIEIYGEVIRHDPRQVFAYHRRGLLLAGKKEFERAIEDYTSALDHESGFGLLRFHRAAAYLKSDRAQAAIDDLDVAISRFVDDEDQPKWLRLRAEARRKLGDTKAAEADVVQADNLEASLKSRQPP